MAGKAKTEKDPAGQARPLFSAVGLADLFRIDEKTVRNYVRDGMPVITKAARGRAAQIDPADALEWIVAKEKGDGNEFNRLKTAKLSEEERRIRIENDKTSGKLVDIDEVINFFQELLVTLANRLDGVPGKASGGDPVLRAKLLDEHRIIRTWLFKDIVELLRPSIGDQQADLATAKAGKLGMGAGKKSPPKRGRGARTVQPKKNAVDNRNKRSRKKPAKS